MFYREVTINHAGRLPDGTLDFTVIIHLSICRLTVRPYHVEHHSPYFDDPEECHGARSYPPWTNVRLTEVAAKLAALLVAEDEQAELLSASYHAAKKDGSHD